MKLRVKVNKQTRRVELEGAEPTLSQLSTRVREDVLPSAGLRVDTEFSLSLNGKEPLVDTGQTLSSCGVVSGDLLSVILAPSDSSSSSPLPSSQQGHSMSGVQQDIPQIFTGEAEPSPSSSRESACAREMEEMDVERGEAEDDREDEDEEEAVGLFIPEPMLCSEAEDGKIPHSLEMLYQAAQCTSATDCLMLAVHVLLLETGFLPQGCEVNCWEMPSSWRAAGGVYRLQYSHSLCEGSVVQVVSVQMAQTLVINTTLKISSSVESPRKLVLKPDSFVTKEWAGGSAGKAYRDLQKLSCVFKDQLAYPLIASAREALGLPALFGLATLPPELLLRIMRLLDVLSVLKLSEVCRHLSSVTQDASLWKHLVHRDFRVNIQADTAHRDRLWKELYKKKFKEKKRQSKYRYFPFPVPPRSPFSPVPIPLPFPFLPPGIIGGEHDQGPVIPQIILPPLPRPRFDPLAPDPSRGFPFSRRLPRPGGGRAADTRRGFI